MLRCCHVAYSGQHQCRAEIYYFLVFNIKNIYILCFLMYTYYKRILMVSGFALAKRCLEKVFRPARNVLTIIIHKLFSDAWVFIYCFIYWSLFFYLLFSTSRYSKLISFMFYLVYSLSTWFTHSFIFSIFRLGTVLAHPRRGKNS